MSDYNLNTQVLIETDFVLPTDRVHEAVIWLLNKHDVAPGTGISIVTVTDEEMQRLNRQFRAVDAPTDVLSFPSDSEQGDNAEEPYLGDLVLALPYIQRQAEAEQHDLNDELILAVVHGTLHLLGYDHDTPDNQSAMWDIQSRALHALGVEIEVPLFEFELSDDDDTGRAG